MTVLSADIHWCASGERASDQREEDEMTQANKQPALSGSTRLPESSHPTGQGRLERLGPMIHELIAWDLVSPSGAGTFVLREDVQHRLVEVWAQQSRLRLRYLSVAPAIVAASSVSRVL